MATPETPFGPTGEVVYKRSYSRPKSDGTLETWPETVRRVVHGNLALVYGYRQQDWPMEVHNEYTRLVHYMNKMAVIPAGRQLWASGVEGRQFLFNCHVSGWEGDIAEHFKFTFMRLVEGGGVGANYSDYLTHRFGAPHRPIDLQVVSDTDHQDYEKLRPYLSKQDYPIGLVHTVEDTREGWADALGFLFDVAYGDYTTDDKLENMVVDVTYIRPEGSPLITSGGVAAGPAPLAKMLLDVVDLLNKMYENKAIDPITLMEIDHAISVGAIAGGSRRSARMSILKWDDPHIFEFINCKASGKSMWTTNISIEIDNEFINYIQHPEFYPTAAAIHRAACEAVLNNGEPGYWNSDLSREGEPGYIIATNPCGEIPLEAWEACNLGHVNLDAFVDHNRALGYDYDALVEAHRLITRFLIRSTYGDITDDRQRKIQDRNRRIGVGHFGVQGFFVKALEIPYSQIAKPGHGGGMLEPSSILRQMYKIVREAAISYAHDLRIPVPVKLTTVAPTGTIAKMPGVTEGLHPIYAKWYERRVRFSLRRDVEFEQVLDYTNKGYTVEQDVYDDSGMTSVVVFPTEDILVAQVRELGLNVDLVESAEQLTIEDMLELQAFYQEHWADNAVSYTVNIPEGTVTPDELGQILAKYLPRLKGTTIMVDASREQAPYTRITEQEYTVAVNKASDTSYDEACATGACPVK